MGRTPKEMKKPAPAKKAKGRTIEILDMNPKQVPYKNPANFTYVEATVTDKDGNEETGIYLLSNDQIKRIEAGQ